MSEHEKVPKIPKPVKPTTPAKPASIPDQADRVRTILPPVDQTPGMPPVKPPKKDG